MATDVRLREWLRAYFAEVSFFFRHDTKYRWSILRAVISSVLTIVLFSWPTSLLLKILALFSLVFVVYEVWQAYRERQSLLSVPPGGRVEIALAERIRKNEGAGPAEFRDLKPTASARGEGYEQFRFASCREGGIASQATDDNIASAVAIKFTREEQRLKVLSDDYNMRRFQLSFLFHSVRNARRKRLVNDDKVYLVSSPRLNNTPLRLGKTNYFNSLITMEAFRSTITLKDSVGREIDVVNGTEWFPMTFAGDDAELNDLPARGISSHIGTTPFVLSADGYPLFAMQRPSNNIGAGNLVLRGSGSMDWADLGEYPGRSNLLEVLARSMAREVLEEAAIRSAATRASGLKMNQADLLGTLADQTLITGYFRWVERCGKPEFLGAMRLPEEIGQPTFDGYEVEYHKFLDVWNTPISTSGDIIRLYEHLAASTEFTVGLSTIMALRRAAEIASTKDSNDSVKTRIFRRFTETLRLAG